MATREPGGRAGVEKGTANHKSTLEFSVLSYVPNLLDTRGVNIAVIVVGGGYAKVRFVPDWKRVLAVDPSADVELLAAVTDDIRETLKSSYEGDKLLGTMEKSWSNTIRVSSWKGCLTDDVATEIDALAAQYLADGRA